MLVHGLLKTLFLKFILEDIVSDQCNVAISSRIQHRTPVPIPVPVSNL